MERKQQKRGKNKMRKNKLVKRLSSLTLCTAMIFSLGAGMNHTTVTKAASQSEDAKMTYIVLAESKNVVSKLSGQYEETDNVNDNSDELAEKNNILALKMTDSDASRLEAKDEIKSVEKDSIVSASTITKFSHPKKVKMSRKSKKDSEWNIQMIRADKKKKKSKNKVKVAVLDSGVDYGNDIELSYSVSLVPGEEEMNPLFMDGTGHGNSVAGLIAACDNNEGITGVNPNAEIYSIRVLDDNNQAPISRVIEGIYMAIEQKVNIINMSFGISQYSEALHQAIKDASDAGILLIAAVGNTGENGVQYPAAFDEVMAVGSVDKNGEVVDSSAKGEEVELVAPGELVRSTGMFGDQLVSSGTSLAAPQVSGVASLIWQNDLSMSSELVRYIINSSANLYGDREKYGNGLLDANFAMINYEKVKKNFGMNEFNGMELFQTLMKSNCAEVCCFEDTGCVAGSWTIEQHGKLISSSNKYLKAGAKFNDNKEKRYLVNGTNMFYGMEAHPWWHGYYKLKSKQEKCNYISTYIYETKWANYQLGNLPKPSLVNGLSKSQSAEIEKSINKINWNKELGTISDKNALKRAKRAFIWGMAIHNLTDAFSHSTYVKIDGKYKYVAHDGLTGITAPPHNTSSTKWAGKERFEAATVAANASYNMYAKQTISAGTFSEFATARKAKNYKMANIYKYMEEVAGNLIASTYKSCNYTT